MQLRSSKKDGNFKYTEWLYTFLKQNNIRTIEGPVAYYIISPTEHLQQLLGREPPTILLFGDHHDQQTYCSKPASVTLYSEQAQNYFDGRKRPPSFLEALDNFSKQINNPIDIYVESWGNAWYDENKSALGSVINELLPCAFKDQMSELGYQCSYEYLRAHHTDLRKRKEDAENILSVIKDAESIDDVQDWLNNHKWSKDFVVEDVLKLVVKRIKYGSIQFFLDVFLESPFFIAGSKAYKQWMQIDENVRELLISALQTCPIYQMHAAKSDQPQPNLLPQTSSYTFEEIQDIVKDVFAMNQEDEYNKSWMQWLGFTMVVDIYFIARSLKIPLSKQTKLPVLQDAAKLVVGYYGDQHSLSIVNWLVEAGCYTLQHSYSFVPEPYYRYNKKIPQCVQVDLRQSAEEYVMEKLRTKTKQDIVLHSALFGFLLMYEDVIMTVVPRHKKILSKMNQELFKVLIQYFTFKYTWSVKHKQIQKAQNILLFLPALLSLQQPWTFSSFLFYEPSLLTHTKYTEMKFLPAEILSMLIAYINPRYFLTADYEKLVALDNPEINVALKRFSS